MYEWKAAMVLIAPMMRGHQQLRTWVAMFGASIATFFVHDAVGYIAIDAIAAALVMARPAGLPQKAIGALFVFMVLFDLGFLLSPLDGWGLFVQASTALGWVQWLILVAWAGNGIWGRYNRWNNALDRPPPAYSRRA